MEAIRRSLAGGPVVVVDPLRVQYMVAKLSVESFVVRSRMSKHWAAHSCWKRLPASSRSELLMSPVGLSKVTRRSRMFLGKTTRHRMGRRVVRRWRRAEPFEVNETTRLRRGMAESSGNQTPPAPKPEASWAPTRVGAVGTNSCMRVGLSARSLRIHSKSAKASWKDLVRRRRLPSEERRAACNELNKPRVPGRASDIDRSSPRIWYHRSRDKRDWVTGMLASSSAKRCSRRGGRRIVIATVSISQPRTFLRVLQLASPWRSFLTDWGCLR